MGRGDKIIWEWLKEAAAEYCQAKSEREAVPGYNARLAGLDVRAWLLVKKRLANFERDGRIVNKALDGADAARAWEKGGVEYAKELIRRIVAERRKKR